MEFNEDKAKEMLAKYFGISKDIMQASKVFEYGNGHACNITVTEGPKKGQYSVFSDGTIV